VTKPVVLDSGPLGRISHPRADKKSKELVDWLKRHLSEGTTICIPEIADYEVRRELLRAKKSKGIERLNQLKSVLTYLPLDTEAMLMAAEFWAEARKLGKPTADSKALDGDVILAAQAAQANGVIATENVGHLSLFVEAASWRDIG
jgi:predicted nucleic acid-binding protein